jgi:hypothetical protein
MAPHRASAAGRAPKLVSLPAGPASPKPTTDCKCPYIDERQRRCVAPAPASRPQGPHSAAQVQRHNTPVGRRSGTPQQLPAPTAHPAHLAAAAAAAAAGAAASPTRSPRRPRPMDVSRPIRSQDRQRSSWTRSPSRKLPQRKQHFLSIFNSPSEREPLHPVAAPGVLCRADKPMTEVPQPPVGGGVASRSQSSGRPAAYSRTNNANGHDVRRRPCRQAQPTRAGRPHQRRATCRRRPSPRPPSRRRRSLQPACAVRRAPAPAAAARAAPQGADPRRAVGQRQRHGPKSASSPRNSTDAAVDVDAPPTTAAPAPDDRTRHSTGRRPAARRSPSANARCSAAGAGPVRANPFARRAPSHSQQSNSNSNSYQHRHPGLGPPDKRRDLSSTSTPAHSPQHPTLTRSGTLARATATHAAEPAQLRHPGRRQPALSLSEGRHSVTSASGSGKQQRKSPEASAGP